MGLDEFEGAFHVDPKAESTYFKILPDSGGVEWDMRGEPAAKIQFVVDEKGRSRLEVVTIVAGGAFTFTRQPSASEAFRFARLTASLAPDDPNLRDIELKAVNVAFRAKAEADRAKGLLLRMISELNEDLQHTTPV